MPFKLNYKIVGRRQIEGDKEGLDFVDVEWTHAEGPVKSTILKPMTHPPQVEYAEVEVEPRAVIPDQIAVKAGTPDSIVMQICEEKRARLAANLGVQP